MKREIPSLGTTGREIWQAWKALSPYPGEVIEAFALGCPTFFMNAYGEVEVSEHFPTVDKNGERTGAYISTLREPTKEEIADLHEAIDRGWLQIEGRKHWGCLGVMPYENPGQTVRVYHQATGTPLQEWLETEAGQKWDADCKRRAAKLERELAEA